MYYFYILQSIKKPTEIYSGSTNDLKNRILQHNQGKIFSTKRYMPWRLVYYEAYLSEKDARIREQKFKRHGKGNIELKKRLKYSLSNYQNKKKGEAKGFTPHLFSKKKGEGFTLIEIIIYIAIVSVISAAVVNFAWNIIYGGVKTSSWQEVQQNTRFAMERITQAVRSASGINSPGMGNSANSLSLQMADPGLNPTVFDVSEDKIRLTQGTNGPYELTTDELEVTNLNFTNLSYAGTSGTIRIEITIEHKNPEGGIEYEASIDMASTVSLRP